MSKSSGEFALLHEMVYSHLKRAIMEGTFKPEERIVELDIARKMDTSQGPVREALMRLEKEGLVVRYQHRGTFVSPLPSPDTLPEIYALRCTLEELAVRRAIGRITDQQVDQVQALVDDMKELARVGDLPRYFDADLAFHDLMFRICEHEVLHRVWSDLAVQIRRLLPLTREAYASQLQQVAEEHQPLVDALRARDFASWQDAWRGRHMQYIWSDLGVGSGASARPG